jgi:hypothetical protein
VAPCSMNSTIRTPFLSQNTVAIRFLADVCMTFWACLVNVCASTALTAFWCQHSQMKPRFHHLFVRCSSEFHRILCRIAIKNQSRSHSLRFVSNREHFRNTSRAKLVIA